MVPSQLAIIQSNHKLLNPVVGNKMLFFVGDDSISDNELATIGPSVVTTAPPTTKSPKVDTLEDSIGLSVEAILAYALGGSSFLLSMSFFQKFSSLNADLCT